MNQQRVVVIANPRAGLRKGAWALERVREALGGLDVSAQIHTTERPEHAVVLAREATEAGCDRIVAVGGDGTFHEVVHGVLSADAEARPAVGIVPVGGGNDYARMFGLPGNDPVGCLRRVVEASPKRVDAGRAAGLNPRRRASFPGEPEYFVNNLGLGYLAAANASREVTRQLPGKLSYLMAGLYALLRFQPARTRVEVDGVAIQGVYTLIQFGIGRYCGAGLEFILGTAPDDGNLDVYLHGDVSKWVTALKWKALSQGGRTEDASILHGRRVRVVGPRDMVAHIDGEIRWVPDGVLEVTLMPGALEICV